MLYTTIARIMGVACQKYSFSRPGFTLLLGFVFLWCVAPFAAEAHESWVLTAEQMAAADAKPMPAMFTSWNPTSIWTLLLSAAFLGGWILLHFTGAKELFPDLQVRLASYGEYGALSVRIGLGIMLFLAAFGLGPRHGTELFEASTFLAPDLELRSVPGNWQWIAWVEGVLAYVLILGIYVRFAAFVFLLLSIVGLYLFPYDILAYYGIGAGTAVYLLLQGGGAFTMPLPQVPGTARIVSWLANQPRERAMWLMRVLAGACFVYLGLEYKYHRGNLMLALIDLHSVNTFGFEPETFVLIMVAVETLAGLFMLTGVLMRPMTVVLFCAFMFFTFVFGEGVLSHSIAYGLLGAFLTVGAGRWRRPVATDKSGKVVILGGGFAGTHSAIKLERLRGRYSNVEVTLVHHEGYFQFDPLISEVVAGAVQPGHIINSLRSICPRTKVIEGRVANIDPSKRKVMIARKAGGDQEIDYDQLIIALDKEVNTSLLPGLDTCVLPLATVGDAMLLRRNILNALAKAEGMTDPQERRRILRFCCLGAGLTGCGGAAAIRTLINAALPTHPGIQDDEIEVLVLERRHQALRGFDRGLAKTARKRLDKMGVEVRTGQDIVEVVADGIVFSNSEVLRCGTTVAAISNRSPIISRLPVDHDKGRLVVNEFLQTPEKSDILVAGDSAESRWAVPFMALREIRMGRRAGYNAYAGIQGYRPRPWHDSTPWLGIVTLGRRAAVGRFWGLPLGSFAAWTLSRIVCVLTLPGLERNLRILIDWGLDVIFRNDITVWAPAKPAPALVSSDATEQSKIEVLQPEQLPDLKIAVEG